MECRLAVWNMDMLTITELILYDHVVVLGPGRVVPDQMSMGTEHGVGTYLTQGGRSGVRDHYSVTRRVNIESTVSTTCNKVCEDYILICRSSNRLVGFLESICTPIYSGE